MHISGNIAGKLKRPLATGAWFLLTVYFAFHAFHGENSLTTLKSLKIQEQQLANVEERVAEKRAFLERRVALMNSDNIDPDLLEEQIRKRLGFTHPDEVVLFIE